MTPLRVTATNYGPYASLDWEIPSGLTALVGRNTVGDGADSNGSGKTKLLELIPICLFGPTLPWSEYLTVGSEETICTVALEFKQGDQTYRVQRTYDAKGRGKTTLDFTRKLPSAELVGFDNEWEPLTRSDQKETQALIDATVGMSESTFAHSVFAAQGARHFADPSLPPRERKAILTEALDLGAWDDLAKLCAAERADVTAEIAALDQRVSAFEGDLAMLPQLKGEHAELVSQSALAANDLAGCEEAVATATGHHDSLKASARERESAVARRDATAGALAAFERVEQEATDAAALAATITAEIASLEPLAANAAELAGQVAQRAAAEVNRGQAAATRAMLLRQFETTDIRTASLRATATVQTTGAGAIREEIVRRRDHDPGSCDHCGQTLAGDALQKALASLLADAKALDEAAAQATHDAEASDAQATALQAQLDGIPEPEPLEANDDLLARNRVAQDATNTLLTLRERLAGLETTARKTSNPDFLEKHTAATVAWDDAHMALAALPEFDTAAFEQSRRDMERASTDLAVARSEDRRLQAAVAASGERLRNLASLAERAQGALKEKDGLNDRLNVLTALARSYGRDGIPALILEASAIPHIENESRRVLEALGMPFRIELVTQRENKGGGLKDTLDVVVHEPNGARSYQTYSGGERTRLELALRIALARLIAHRSSSAGILCLDEPAFLDATGMAQVADVLRGLTEFRSIVLVSHDERLVEAFDQVVVVARDESGSRLGGAA